MPDPITLLMPFSTPGIYSFGTAPPTIFDSKAEPAPASFGSKMILTRANWPVPPVCFLCVWSISTRLRHLLAIGDLRLADIRVDLIGALQNIDLDVEMQFAHALDDRLAGFLIGRDAEGRIFGGELGERDAELLLIAPWSSARWRSR